MRTNPRHKAFLEPIEPDHGSSFRCFNFKREAFDFGWHYHPECELTLIIRGSGLRFVGDSIRRFSAGDLCLLGADLPHTWSSQPEDGKVESLVAQFDPSRWSPEQSELRWLPHLLQRARRGQQVTGRSAAQASALFRKTMQPGISSFERWIHLLNALRVIDAAKTTPLASPAYQAEVERPAGRRLRTVLQLIHTRSPEQVSQPELAAKVGMTPQGFSRFFKRQVGRTFSEYLNHWRLSAACRLLAESDRAITDIAMDVGFANLSNFNRRFKENYQMTPREFRQQSLPSIASSA